MGFAIVGMMRGTAFVEITNPTNPIYLGVLPAHVSGSSMWRDIKTYKNYAYVVSEQYGHGMQIFDLTELLDADPSSVFEETGHYDGFGNAHNLFINEETGYAYAVGTDECNAGLYIMELKTDSDSSDDEEMDFVEFQACFGDDGYVHDVQCVVYHGA